MTGCSRVGGHRQIDFIAESAGKTATVSVADHAYHDRCGVVIPHRRRWLVTDIDDDVSPADPGAATAAPPCFD